MMLLADLAQLAIAGKNRVAGRRRIVVGESISSRGTRATAMARSRVCAGRAASAGLPCPQALTRPIARFAGTQERYGPQVRPRAPAKFLARAPAACPTPQLTRIVSCGPSDGADGNSSRFLKYIVRTRISSSSSSPQPRSPSPRVGWRG